VAPGCASPTSGSSLCFVLRFVVRSVCRPLSPRRVGRVLRGAWGKGTVVSIPRGVGVGFAFLGVTSGCGHGRRVSGAVCRPVRPVLFLRWRGKEILKRGIRSPRAASDA